jgi:GGDEF domain-containing protein
VQCSCSIGITEVHADDERLDSVLTRADQALYVAKRAGRDQWSFAA